MQRPLEITFKNVDRTEAMETLVREKMARLERFYDGIVGSQVALERPSPNGTQNHPGRVRIRLTVPRNHEIVVVKEPPDAQRVEDLKGVVHDAFEAVERQLKALADRH